jgi:broad specificity phosphatase PhoE
LWSLALSDEVVLIRHEETAMAGHFCGHSDPPLNTRGIKQLPALVNKLERWDCTHLYSSDLLRARQTAQAIARERAIFLELRIGLREMCFGTWEGLTWSEIEALDKDEATRWLKEYPSRTIPGGEDYGSFATRVEAEADFLFQQTKKERVGAVTHAGVIRTILGLRCNIADQQAWQWTKEYGAIVVITRQGRVAYTSSNGERSNG